MLFILTSYLSNSQTVSAVDDYILGYMKDNKTPGLAVGVIKDGKLAWSKGYGYADIEKDIPFTPNTIMHEIASISKTVTATAIFQLWEDGLFQLDDPINNYLPFAINNPFYPDIPITFRMLLSHKSSIHINDLDPVSIMFGPPGTLMSLGDFIQNRLVPGGIFYNFETPSFHNFQPGAEYQYSNTGYALLGYLVERISGIRFNEFCNQHIFQPLCMNNTGWYFSEVDTNIVARPYSELANNTRDIGLFEQLYYPCSQLKTTIVDLSKYLLMHMNYGILDGVRILEHSTEAMMRQVQHVLADIPGVAKLGYSHGFEYVNYYPGAVEYVGHSGGHGGVASDMYQNITDNTGVIVFQNVREPITRSVFLFFDEQVTDTLTTASQPLLTCSYAFNPCQRNSAFWKNNPDQWALNAMPMKLGKHYYQKQRILDLLNQTANNDASLVLAKALITAKFNVAQGSELSPVILTINAAMGMIGNKHLPSDEPVHFSSPLGIQMLAIANTLESYNTGQLNTTACTGTIESITSRNNAYEIEKSPALQRLSVYPNPSSGISTIAFEVPGKEKISLRLFDMNGRLIKILAEKVLHEGAHQFTWNVSDLNAGVYVVQLQTLTRTQTRKIVVIK